jgi:hypothetical protein
LVLAQAFGEIEIPTAVNHVIPLEAPDSADLCSLEITYASFESAAQEGSFELRRRRGSFQRYYLCRQSRVACSLAAKSVSSPTGANLLSTNNKKATQFYKVRPLRITVFSLTHMSFIYIVQQSCFIVMW